MPRTSIQQHKHTSKTQSGKCECSERGSYHILYGAIVGGPTEDDYHYDKCGDFITNEGEGYWVVVVVVVVGFWLILWIVEIVGGGFG